MGWRNSSESFKLSDELVNLLKLLIMLKYI